MSDLKHLSVEQLQGCKTDCEHWIDAYKTKIAGQEERLKWINKYLFEKTPQELTWAQIEAKLGHKVIVKPGRV